MKKGILSLAGILLLVNSLSAHTGSHGGTGFSELVLHLFINHWGLALLFGMSIFYAFYAFCRSLKKEKE